MKSSPRDLLLVPGSGRLNKKRRYFSLRSAIHRALRDVVDTKIPIVVHDTHRGVDIVSIRQTIGQVRIYIDSPRRFNQLWSR